MNIREALLEEHSKAQTMKIVQFIGKNQDRFDQLMDLFFNDEYRVTQRAAWVVRYATEAHRPLFQPHLERIIEHLKNPTVHDAVKRNSLKLLTEMEIPSSLWGELVNICFGFLDDPQQAIAIRVFSMEILYQITLQEPDLADELKLLIEDHWEHASAGFRSRGKKVLKGLAKLQKDN